MGRLTWRGLTVAMLGIATSACALRAPAIGDIQHNSARYLDRKVEVKGTVTSAWNVPFMPFGLYKVDDGTGEMSVEIDGSPFDNPEQLAGVLLGFAQMIATGETVGVQVPNFPPEPEEQP